MPKRRVLGNCYLCGQPGAMEREHVVPRGLFAVLPDNLITAPAHRACNASYSLDEEFLRVWLASTSYEHPEARALWTARVRPGLASRPAFRAGLRQRLVPAEVRTREGLYLGKVDGMLAERSRIDRVVEKMVRGLHRHHGGRRLRDVRFDVFLNPAEMLQELLPPEVPTSPLHGRALLGAGVLEYAWLIPPLAPDETVWWLRFYEKHLLLVLTEPLSTEDLELTESDVPGGSGGSQES